AAGPGRDRLRTDLHGHSRGRPAGHRVLRLAGAARAARRHHARRADYRDADPPGARADPLGLVRADRVRDLRCARFYLGNDLDERAAAGRVGSVYLTGVVGGIVIGSALGGLVASVWGVTAPFWFAFAGSALILALIW